MEKMIQHFFLVLLQTWTQFLFFLSNAHELWSVSMDVERLHLPEVCYFSAREKWCGWIHVVYGELALYLCSVAEPSKQWRSLFHKALAKNRIFWFYSYWGAPKIVFCHCSKAVFFSFPGFTVPLLCLHFLSFLASISHMCVLLFLSSFNRWVA